MQNTYIQFTIAIGTSFIGSWLFFYYIKEKEKRIKKKLLELDNYEKYLNDLSKGNITLIRKSFQTLFILLFLILSSMTLEKIGEILGLSLITNMLSISILGASALISLEFFRSITKIENITEVKKQLKVQKETLSKKLD